MDVWVVTVDPAPAGERPVVVRRYRQVDGRTLALPEWQWCASVADAYFHLPGDRTCICRRAVDGKVVEIWV